MLDDPAIREQIAKQIVDGEPKLWKPELYRRPGYLINFTTRLMERQR